LAREEKKEKKRKKEKKQKRQATAGCPRRELNPRRKKPSSVRAFCFFFVI
jgi:hypothetical protein